MKTHAQVAELVRERSPLPAPETERLIRSSFAPPRVVRFLCRHYGADRLAVLDVGCGRGEHLVHFGPGSVGLDATCRSAVDAAGFCVPRGTQTGGVPSARSHTLFWLSGRISAFVQASTWEISPSARVRVGIAPHP